MAAPANRLAAESSPYLLQHAHNPVDWFPWGEEAFTKAREENRPIFLSIGYSTCHWCHVMERESFENPEIAALLNEKFVAIKVDREERPDIDNIYMDTVQALTGSGGWPLSVFLTPEGKPFAGGTYFPPESRFGRPGFKELLQRVADLWSTRQEEILADAERLTGHLQERLRMEPGPDLAEDVLDQGYRQFASGFDPTHGGFGHQPKFPRSHVLSFLLQYWKRKADPEARSMVEQTLDAMDAGGIHDHLGGGFHRYSTDRTWLVPHFEKMLYDQALLALSYVEAYQVTGAPRHAEAARDILGYVSRVLTSPEGGFYTAEDADSEGVEGKYYVWTLEEIRSVLGEEDAALFAEAYGVSAAGNFREEASGEPVPANILHRPRSLEALAEARELDPGGLASRLATMRERLLAEREKRIHPLKDDKILTDWNGLALAAFARAGRVLEEPEHLETARKAARFLLERMRTPEGRLLHRYRDGDAAIPAYLDDHAFLALGLLELYEATGEPQWLGAAADLAREMLRLFWDDEAHGFFLAGSDTEKLVARTKEIYDGAVPSGNSVAALVLLRLGRLLLDPEMESRGRETLDVFSGLLSRAPTAFPFALLALDFAIGPTQEVVVSGDPGDPEVKAMLGALRRRYLPRTVFVHLPPDGPEARELLALIPPLEAQVASEGRPTAYVCQGYVCELPVHTAAEMTARLGSSDATE